MEIFYKLYVIITLMCLCLHVDDIHTRVMQTGNLLLVQEKDAEYMKNGEGKYDNTKQVKTNCKPSNRL